ncbi:MAG: hypothetical protein HY704_00370 [Gemmatimonadetes bacterium]|nr:hypothetical protein [Gemmatimonadota bacterium]
MAAEDRAGRRAPVCGVEMGYSSDFGHRGSVVGQAATREVWPRVAFWLEEH